MTERTSDLECTAQASPGRLNARRWVLAVSMLVAILITACSGDNEGVPPDTTVNETTTTSTIPAVVYDFDEVSELMAGFVAQQGLTGAGLVVVEQDDGVIHEEYWGEFDAERPTLIASASKMLSAGVLMKLDDEGRLDIDAPVADVVEWGSGNPDITPAQLISNSSGLVGIYPDPVYLPYICQYVPDGTLQDCAEAIFSTTEDDADVIAPDTTFRYGGGQWQVAGAVAEAASGQSWAELINDTYVEPCGLEPDSLGYSNYISQMGNGIDYPTEFNADPSTLVTTDNPNIEQGGYATPQVFAEILLMYLRGGECGDGHQVLSQQAIDRMVADRIQDAYGGSAGSGRGYGLGWWVNRQGGFVYSIGAYGAVPTLNLNEGYGYYLVLEANDATWQAIDITLGDAIESAVATARD